MIRMELASFIENLLDNGSVSVASTPVEFSEADLKQSEILLKRYYENDIIHMPSKAPDFFPEAALWAAQYLYNATQLIMLRDQDELKVKERLVNYRGEITPEAIYSTDLSLRFLQDIIDIAKGLAPDDILVKCIYQTASDWPFSSVGMELPNEIIDLSILKHASLKSAYIDRIIIKKDLKRAKQEKVALEIQEVLGNYSHILWPDFLNIQTITQ